MKRLHFIQNFTFSLLLCTAQSSFAVKTTTDQKEAKRVEQRLERMGRVHLYGTGKAKSNITGKISRIKTDEARDTLLARVNKAKKPGTLAIIDHEAIDQLKAEGQQDVWALGMLKRDVQPEAHLPTEQDLRGRLPSVASFLGCNPESAYSMWQSCPSLTTRGKVVTSISLSAALLAFGIYSGILPSPVDFLQFMQRNPSKGIEYLESLSKQLAQSYNPDTMCPLSGEARVCANNFMQRLFTEISTKAPSVASDTVANVSSTVCSLGEGSALSSFQKFLGQGLQANGTAQIPLETTELSLNASGFWEKVFSRYIDRSVLIEATRRMYGEGGHSPLMNFADSIFGALHGLK